MREEEWERREEKVRMGECEMEEAREGGGVRERKRREKRREG